MPHKVTLNFIPNREDEGTWQDDPDVQADIVEAERLLKEAGLKVSSGAYVRKSLDYGTLLTGEFGLIVGGTTLAATALKAWITGRMGRKVRIKVGDVEVEAATLKEVEAALEKAKALQSKE